MIGVIGGSGLYEFEGVKLVDEVYMCTPFGTPSDRYIITNINGKKVIFLPRHGKGHRIPPHLINYRANIWGFRKLGVDRIISVSAVGGINPLLQPGDFVISDQFIDFTKGREHTFYEGEFSKDDDTGRDDLISEYLNSRRVVHIDVSDPFCSHMKKTAEEVFKKNRLRFLKGATYIATEGPRLETSAEIRAFSSIGADIVGMTLVPEVVLARELNIHFLSVSVVTNPAAGIKGDRLTSKEVIEMMKKKNEEIKKFLIDFVSVLPDELVCNCEEVLLDAAI